MSNTNKIEDNATKVCEERRHNTPISNARTELVNLLIASVIETNRKGEHDVPAYSAPLSIARLEVLPRAKATPVPQC